MDYIALGKRIREIRKLRNYTQHQVAEQLHFSPKHLGNIERGHANPSLECLVSIANVLHISVDYLLQDSLNPEDNNQSLEILNIVEFFISQQHQHMDSFQKSLYIMLKKRPPKQPF